MNRRYELNELDELSSPSIRCAACRQAAVQTIVTLTESAAGSRFTQPQSRHLREACYSTLFPVRAAAIGVRSFGPWGHRPPREADSISAAAGEESYLFGD